MSISITWATKIIYVPKADTTLIQSVPNEIRELDLNWFRYQLKDLEDNEAGMPNDDTHSHNTEVTVGGLTLARVISIINGYTVTFEDGQYAVNLIGANSNVGDVINVNQVSVRTANSAGMVTSAAIEYGEYNGGVMIDELHGESGTIYPVGTERRPVDNISDAHAIAESRGFGKFFFKHDYTLNNEALADGYLFIGESLNVLTIDPSANVVNCQFHDMKITGTLDGNNSLRDCIINGLAYVNGLVHECGILSPSIILGGVSPALFLNCYSLVPGSSDCPTIDFNGTTTPLAMREWVGDLELINKTQVLGEVSIDIMSGTVYIRSSCTAGTITVRGRAVLVDESGPGCIVDSVGLLEPDNLTTMVDMALRKASFNSVTGRAIHYDNSNNIIKEFDVTESGDTKTRTPV